jgi:hypothetical protein
MTFFTPLRHMKNDFIFLASRLTVEPEVMPPNWQIAPDKKRPTVCAFFAVRSLFGEFSAELLPPGGS